MLPDRTAPLDADRLVEHLVAQWLRSGQPVAAIGEAMLTGALALAIEAEGRGATADMLHRLADGLTCDDAGAEPPVDHNAAIAAELRRALALVDSHQPDAAVELLRRLADALEQRTT